jgi:aminomethyltransferase
LDSDINYIGKDALIKIKKQGVKRKQVGLIIDCKPLEGPNTTFWSIEKEGNVIGKITSAVYSPRLKKNIALAMIDVKNSEINTELQVLTNKGKFNAKVVEKPFYDPKKKIANS